MTGSAIVGSTLFNYYTGDDAAQDAADTSAEATQAAIDESRYQYQQDRADRFPYASMGREATYALSDMMGLDVQNPYDAQIEQLEAEMAGEDGDSSGDDISDLTLGLGDIGGDISDYTGGDAGDDSDVSDVSGSTESYDTQMQDLIEKRDAFNLREQYDFKETEGYQFRLDEGMQALERSQAGRNLGGRALKEAMRYGQGAASSEFGNAFNRLSTLAGYGPPTGGGGGNNTSDLIYQGGQDQAEYDYLGDQSSSDALNQGFQNWMTWQSYNDSGGGWGDDFDVTSYDGLFG